MLMLSQRVRAAESRMKLQAVKWSAEGAHSVAVNQGGTADHISNSSLIDVYLSGIFVYEEIILSR